MRERITCDWCFAERLAQRRNTAAAGLLSPVGGGSTFGFSSSTGSALVDRPLNGSAKNGIVLKGHLRNGSAHGSLDRPKKVVSIQEEDETDLERTPEKKPLKEGSPEVGRAFN